ncbi:Rec8 like protein-domain-containing protein [Xylariaceae sp. FL0016]|nr:Rec8 like protein-domain-containing protein [Xylariaceae sp. FL0016]
MFYSHEILTSQQYGISTVWFVATIGNRSSTKKVTRKAIQEVDIEKACGKILEPGAPIALRLQGSLLYGVTRVYNQQCHYMLTDAKKIQDAMLAFFSTFGANQIDPSVGQAKPGDLVIMDDPAFVPNMQLPRIDLESLLINRSVTQKTSSQMSPLRSSQLSGAVSPGRDFPIDFNVAHSDSSGPRAASLLGLQGLSSAQKPDDEPMLFTQDDKDDVFGGAGDWGLEMDADGNIIERAEPDTIQDEPELPPMPTRANTGDERPKVDQPEEQPIVDEQDDIAMMQEEPLPEAEPFPQSQAHHSAFRDDQAPPQQAPVRRRRRAAKGPQVDAETQLSRNVIKNWQTDYLDHCNNKPYRNPPPAQAKRNGMLLTFGHGLADVGRFLGIPGTMHPLALDFSGDRLFAVLTGIDVPEQASRGRRRNASESVAGSEEEERRVRPRLVSEEQEQEEEKGQQGRGAAHVDDNLIIDDPFVDQTATEIGREAEHPMSEAHSLASQMPWNRGSSMVPSSIHGPGSVQQLGRDISSPLGKRSDPQDIIRFSDGVISVDEGMGTGGFGLNDSLFDSAGQNAYQHAAFDREGQNFLTFIEDSIRENGERREDADIAIGRKWLAFDDLFVPRKTTKAMAAQAFYHALCLTTKGKMYVTQEDREKKPFGAIWFGAKLGEVDA